MTGKNDPYRAQDVPLWMIVSSNFPTTKTNNYLRLQQIEVVKICLILFFKKIFAS